MVETTNYR